MGMLIWVSIIFLFSTLLRVSHVVVSPHTLLRKVVTKCVCVGGGGGVALITIHSSKAKKLVNPPRSLFCMAGINGAARCIGCRN